MYTGYTGTVGFDYRAMTALRPFLNIGGGNFYTKSPDGRDIASGGRFILEAGFLLNEEPALSFGNLGTGFLGGHRAVGLGFNWYSIDNGVPGIGQLSIINRSPFFQAMIPTPIGNLTLGANLFSSNSGFMIGSSQVPGCPAGLSACSTQQVIPASNSVPLSIDVSLEPVNNPVLRRNYARLYPGELAPRITDLTTRQFSSFLSLQDVPRYSDTRLLLDATPTGSMASRDASSTVHVGMDLSFLSLMLSQGRYSADLAQAIRRANTLENVFLIGSQSVMNIGLWAVCGASPGYPSGSDILAGRFGAITDFSGRAACIQAPVATEALGLAILDGVGATGDPNGSTGTQALFWTTHGIAAVVGLVGLINYTRPFGNDPDTIAFSGGTGTVRPSERLPAIDNRFRDNALLALPLTWAVFSYLNRRTPLTFDAAVTGNGAMATVGGRLP